MGIPQPPAPIPLDVSSDETFEAWCRSACVSVDDRTLSEFAFDGGRHPAYPRPHPVARAIDAAIAVPLSAVTTIGELCLNVNGLTNLPNTGTESTGAR